MELLVPLAVATDLSMYGGKTAHLAEAMLADFAVPAGFAMSADSVVELRSGKQSTRNALRSDLLELVQQDNLPGPFAVRSSGRAEDGENSSFAGIYRTVLNVEPTVDSLLAAVEECATAIDADRLREYVGATGVSETGVIAILVQQMISAELAGVAFSDAYGARGEYVLIEAVRGLGEPLVSGTVTPSRYLLSLPLAADATAQHLRVNGDNQLGRHAYDVARLARQAADHFGSPQDVEWAIVGGKLWLLQSRPITVPVTVQDEPVAADAGALLVGFGASPGHVTAKSRVMRVADDQFQPGALLVAVNTDTDFLPAMRQASGFVTEEGGLLSHAALVARELHLPCIVGATNATTTLTDGQLVTIDGGSGLLYDGEVKLTGIVTASNYDFTGLYCFDIVQELVVADVSVIVEPNSDGYAAWLPPSAGEDRRHDLAPLLRKRLATSVHFPVTDKYPIYAAFKRRMCESPVFRTSFGALFMTTWTLDSDGLRHGLRSLLTHSQACLAAAERETDPLATYLLLDAVGGNYLLGNTLFPEGYGIRAVYQAILPKASRADISVSAYLVDARYADDPAVRYYTELAEARESSYPAYLAFGGTDEHYHDRLNAARDHVADDLNVSGQDRDTVLATIDVIVHDRPEVWEQISGLLQTK